MNDIVFLISKHFIFDESGNHIAENSEKRSFAKVESIYGDESNNAAQNNIKASLKVTVWLSEYGGEKAVRYKNEVFSVYRTFVKNDFIELYLAEKVGVFE